MPRGVGLSRRHLTIRVRAPAQAGGRGSTALFGGLLESIPVRVAQCIDG